MRQLLPTVVVAVVAVDKRFAPMGGIEKTIRQGRMTDGRTEDEGARNCAMTTRSVMGGLSKRLTDVRAVLC